MLVIGDREVQDGTVGLRKRGEGDLGAVLFEDFKEQVLEEIKIKNNIFTMKTLEDLIKVLPEFLYIRLFTTMLAFSRHKDVFQVEK